MAAYNPHGFYRKAGLNTAGVTGISAAGVFDPTEFSAKTSPVAADKSVIQDTEDTDAPKVVTLANMAAFYGAFAQMPADLKKSVFVETGEFDFSGSASAVDTKKIDALDTKGQLLVAFISVSQVANGTTSAVLSISSAASAATKMAGDLTITLSDTVYQNKVGNCVVMWPVAGANSIVASGGDVYLYAAASVGRTAGKVKYVLVFMKTA